MAANDESGKSSKKAAAKIEKSSKVYPLYLIPQALSEEIHTKGDSIETILVRRTAGHSYRIETEYRSGSAAKKAEGGDSNE